MRSVFCNSHIWERNLYFLLLDVILESVLRCIILNWYKPTCMSAHYLLNLIQEIEVFAATEKVEPIHLKLKSFCHPDFKIWLPYQMSPKRLSSCHCKNGFLLRRAPSSNRATSCMWDQLGRASPWPCPVKTPLQLFNKKLSFALRSSRIRK